MVMREGHVTMPTLCWRFYQHHIYLSTQDSSLPCFFHNIPYTQSKHIHTHTLHPQPPIRSTHTPKTRTHPIPNFLSNGNQCIAKPIQLSLTLTLSGLHHQRPRHRPTHGGSMIPIVNQPLGDVLRFHTSCIGEGADVEDEFVGTGPVGAPEEDWVVLFEAFCHVVGIEDGTSRCLGGGGWVGVWLVVMFCVRMILHTSYIRYTNVRILQSLTIMRNGVPTHSTSPHNLPTLPPTHSPNYTPTPHPPL